MLHKVVMPFPCSWDGITAVDLNVGDVRDFGTMADGLVGMGWIEPAAADALVEVPAEAPMEFAVVTTPIETAVVRRGRKRK